MTATIALRELTAWRAIIERAFHERWNQGGNWFNWLLVGLTFLVPPVALVLNGQPGLVVAIGLGAPLGLLVLIWWYMLVLSLVQQNGAHARLVPGVARRSVAVLLLAWTAATLVLTLVFSAGGASVGISAAMVGLALVVTASMVLTPFYFVALMVMAGGSSALGLFPSEMNATTLLQAMLVAMMVLGGLVLHALGGLARAVRPTPASPAAITPLLLGSTSWQYAYLLRRDCRSRNTENLLMHCVGPNARPFSPVLSLGAVAVLLTLMHIVPGWVAENRSGLLLLVPVMMVASQIVGAYSMLGAVSATRHEQSVARLAPGIPVASILNRMLGRALLAQFALLWLGTTALTLLVSSLLGAGTGRLLQLLAACLFTLPAAGMLLRDYSAASGAFAWQSGLRLVLLAGAVVATLCAAVGSVDLRLWGMAGAISLAWTVAFGLWRWHVMLAAPAAFPAGRRG